MNKIKETLSCEDITYRVFLPLVDVKTVMFLARTNKWYYEEFIGRFKELFQRNIKKELDEESRINPCYWLFKFINDYRNLIISYEKLAERIGHYDMRAVCDPKLPKRRLIARGSNIYSTPDDPVIAYGASMRYIGFGRPYGLLSLVKDIKQLSADVGAYDKLLDKHINEAECKMWWAERKDRVLKIVAAVVTLVYSGVFWHCIVNQSFEVAMAMLVLGLLVSVWSGCRR